MSSSPNLSLRHSHKSELARTNKMPNIHPLLPPRPKVATPWAVQIEKQQQNLEKYLASSNAKSPTEPNPTPTLNNLFSHKNADQINSIPFKPLLNKASVKILPYLSRKLPQ